MRISMQSQETKERISAAIPISLAEELKILKKNENFSTMNALVQKALEFLVSHHTELKMAEGYRRSREENLELMKEFETIDKELW